MRLAAPAARYGGRERPWGAACRCGAGGVPGGAVGALARADGRGDAGRDGCGRLRAEAWRRYTLIRPLLAWPAGARTRRAIEEYLSSRRARGSRGQRVGPGGYQPGQRGAVPAGVRGERGGHPGAGAGHGAGRRRGGCGCRRGRSSRCMTRSWRRGAYCATGRRAGRGRRSPSSWTSETRIARGGPRFIPAASKSKGVSYKWLVELDAQLRAEIMVLLALAERMDEREQHHRDGAAR
jgi:hypothetical protein